MAFEKSDSPQFYVLQKEVVGSRYEVVVDEVEPISLGKGANCPSCGKPVGMLPWLPPYRVQLEMYGEALGDFIETTGYEFFVSERLKNAFHAEGLTGLQGFHPVEVLRVRRMRKGPKLTGTPQYFAVTTCNSRAALDIERSRIRYAEAPTCDECRYGHKDAIHGFSLETGSWQGQDVFRPRGLNGSLVVSERFGRFVERHGFTNMRLTLTEEHVWNPRGSEPLPTTRQGSA